MNGSYYPNPTFPNNLSNYETDNTNYNNKQYEESYIENILRLNKGQKVKVFCSFPDSNEWRDKIFEGMIEQAGKDHLVMVNNDLNDWYLIPMIYLNWVEFEDKINFKVY